MINFNLIRIARLKGIARPYSYLRSLGIRHGMINHYLSGKHKMVKFADIEKICLDSWCTPNDLFEWKPGPNGPQLPPTHPMNALYRTGPEVNTNQILKTSTEQQIQEFYRMRQNEPVKPLDTDTNLIG